MTDDLIAQGIGLIASALLISAFLYKSDGYFKIFIMCGSLAFALHFYLLGAFAGMIVNIISASRSALALKFHNSNTLTLCILATYLIVAVLIYKTPTDLFPLFSGAYLKVR